MRKYRRVVMSMLICLLAGCSTTVPSYAPRSEPEPALRRVSTKLNLVLKKNSESDQTSIQCRGYGPILSPDGETFGSYIVAAENAELQSADIFSPKEGRLIEVIFDRIDFSTALGNAVWYIDARYKIGDQWVAISTIYQDDNGSSFMADRACRNIATYLRSAVVEHGRQLFQHPVFQQAVGVRVQSPEGEKTNATIQGRLEQLESLRRAGLISNSEYDEQRRRILGGL